VMMITGIVDPSSLSRRCSSRPDIPPTEAGCIVLDLRLRGPSGLDLQEQLTTAGESPADRVPHRPWGRPHAVRAMKAGAVDFLTKPVDAPVLLDAVARGIARDAESRAVRARAAEGVKNVLLIHGGFVDGSRRAGSTVVEVKGSHAVYVSQPKSVAAIIAEAAHGVAVTTQ
jgi:CheY-like chemotaxis protein